MSLTGEHGFSHEWRDCPIRKVTRGLLVGGRLNVNIGVREESNRLQAKTSAS